MKNEKLRKVIFGTSMLILGKRHHRNFQIWKQVKSKGTQIDKIQFSNHFKTIIK